VALASVIGDERPRRSANDQGTEHPEGEREQALGDALGESGDGLGKVVAKAHLALEVSPTGFVLMRGEPTSSL
jgi:hypothetical protein